MSNYYKVAYDEVKNAYVISERDEHGRLLATYTAYPDFKRGTFSCYPRTVMPGERYPGKKTINMSAVETAERN